MCIFFIPFKAVIFEKKKKIHYTEKSLIIEINEGEHFRLKYAPVF